MNRPKTDRGQLILTTGFTIAVVLITLVVLLNTVIYTENLATRGVDAGGADAIEYRATVVGSVGELIEEENERFDEGEPPVDGVENGIVTITETLSERHLIHGAIAEVRSYEIAIDKTSSWIWQHKSSEFTSAGEDPEANWPVMTEVNEFERFVMTVDPTEYAESEEPFRVLVGDWSMEIDVIEIEVDDGGEGTIMEERIEVTVEGDDGSLSEYNYDPDAAPLEIDLVDGTIDVEGRDTVSIETPTSGDVVRYENGDRATGTFELRSDGAPDEGNLTEYGGTNGTAPFYTYLVESVDLAIHYETAELRYTTEATVTAGESA